jgi:hypothetical protein
VQAGGPAGGEGLPRVSSRNANAHATHLWVAEIKGR